MKSVSGATSSASSKSSTSRYACIAALFIGFFFFVSLSGNGSDSDKAQHEVRSGQAKQSIGVISTGGGDGASGSGSNWKDDEMFDNSGGNDEDYDTEQDDKEEHVQDIDPDEVLEDAEERFEHVVEKEESMNKERLDHAISAVMEAMRENLNDLLGTNDDFDQDEIILLANKMEGTLRKRVDDRLDDAISDIMEEETQQVELAVDVDTEGKDPTDADEDPIDLDREETRLAVDLMDHIEDIYSDIEMDLKKMLGMVAKDEFKQHLWNKYGETYTVTIDEKTHLITSFKVSSTKKTSSSHSSSSGTNTTTSSSTHEETSSSSSSSSSGSSSSHAPDKDGDDDEDEEDPERR